MASPTTDKLAVLIDADNAQASIAGHLLAEVSRYGSAIVKRAYGDWTTPNLRGWKEVLQSLAIHPVQQFRYTTGKNATDSSLIIDAMDLLHGGGLSGFCLVSSDSDFTRLATRIREGGLAVYGLGERKTPAPFVAACDKFIFTDILRPQQSQSPVGEQLAVPIEPIELLKPLLMQTVCACARDDGWATLAGVGSLINKHSPSFDPRNYGFAKLGELVRRMPYLEVSEVPTREGSATVHIYVRLAKAA